MAGKSGRQDIGRTLQEAVAAHQAENFFKARKLYERVLSEDASNIHALHYFGILEAQQKNVAKALRLLDRAVAVNPNAADIFADRGKVLAEAGQQQDALNSLQRALTLNPQHWMALQNLGAVLLALKRPVEALAAFDRLLGVMRNHPAAFNNRGLALKDLNRFDEAISSFRQSIALNANDPETWTNLGDSLFKVKNLEEASAAYDKALSIRPDMAQAWLGRGNVLSDRKKYQDAVAAFDQAISTKADLAEAWLGRGSVLSDHKRYAEAAADFSKALELKPDIVGLEGERLHAKMHICDWANFDAHSTHLIEAVRAGKANTAPFPFLAVSSSAEDQMHCATRWSAERFEQQDIRTKSAARDHDKIRIAYLSADFYEHPVSYLMAGLFEHHEKSRFEVTAISIGPPVQSNMRSRLEASFDRFIEAQELSDSDLIAQIDTLEIDILVDLMGFTGIGRTNVLARRAAPIQVNYLGFAGTMGAQFIDYIVADKCVLPDDQKPFYTEKVVHLPGSFMVNDDKRLIAQSSPSRAEFGLPESGFVFCSFNQSYKITPTIFDVWMRLLSKVDGSVLWLSGANDMAVANLKRETSARGVDPERLVFATRVPLNEGHLARHRHADLFLDTLPFNAHSTAADALWAGLPVLTCVGQSFASRVAASLLTAVGLSELITNSLESYESLALELASDHERLAKLRTKLAENRQAMPLFDTALFTRKIEAAYVSMYERHRAGLPPDHIVISD